MQAKLIKLVSLHMFFCSADYFSCFSLLAISAGRKRYKSANLKKIRRHYHQDTLREQIIPDESNRFRYFYHIRRANGDALSSVSSIALLLFPINRYMCIYSLSFEDFCQSQTDRTELFERTTFFVCVCLAWHVELVNKYRLYP